jgi:hypothetical protein
LGILFSEELTYQNHAFNKSNIRKIEVNWATEGGFWLNWLFLLFLFGHLEFLHLAFNRLFAIGCTQRSSHAALSGLGAIEDKTAR